MYEKNEDSFDCSAKWREARSGLCMPFRALPRGQRRDGASSVPEIMFGQMPGEKIWWWHGDEKG